MESKLVSTESEKRRHRRFDMTASGSQAALLSWDDGVLQRNYLELLNLSYGGMCFRSNERLDPGAEPYCLLNLQGFIDDVVFVKARVEWQTIMNTGEFLCGASFLESSKGWLS